VLQGEFDLPRRADSKVAWHLVDRRGDPSSKEGQVDRDYFHAEYTGLLTRNAGFAPCLGRNFCTRPLSTSAT
jgi:hypothetical protein